MSSFYDKYQSLFNEDQYHQLSKYEMVADKKSNYQQVKNQMGLNLINPKQNDQQSSVRPQFKDNQNTIQYPNMISVSQNRERNNILEQQIFQKQNLPLPISQGITRERNDPFKNYAVKDSSNYNQNNYNVVDDSKYSIPKNSSKQKQFEKQINIFQQDDILDSYVQKKQTTPITKPIQETSNNIHTLYRQRINDIDQMKKRYSDKKQLESNLDYNNSYKLAIQKRVLNHLNKDERKTKLKLLLNQ